MPKNEEKLSLDDLELTAEEAEQVNGGARTLPGTLLGNSQVLVAGPRPDQTLVFGPRPDQTLVFGPRPDQIAIDSIAGLDFNTVFNR